MEKNSIDASIFLCSSPIHDSNIQYFTGFQQTRFWAFSCLVINRKESILVPSRLEYDRAIREAEADEIINIKDYDNSLSKILKEKLGNEKKIGIIENIFPYKLARKLKDKKFQDISGITDELRSTKTRKEIELIRKSCEIANHGIRTIKENISEPITERELAIMVEQELILQGAEEISFPTIVTSGERSAYVHPEPSFSDKKIQKGLGLIDFGARYKGYCSDITVPFSVGDLSKTEEKILETVENIYQKSIEYLEVGVPAWKLYDKADKITKENGFESKHSLGHGLGLDVHESPNLSPKPTTEDELKGWKETLLKEGMIFTVEPGVYVPGIGGSRLENDVLMTRKGPEILTKSSFIEF